MTTTITAGSLPRSTRICAIRWPILRASWSRRCRQNTIGTQLPYEVVAQMGEMGCSACRSRRSTGDGGDYFALSLALEELGKVDQSVAITLEAGTSLGAIADLPIRHGGTEEQVAADLIAAGRWRFRAHRARAGSDAGGTRSTARLESGEW